MRVPTVKIDRQEYVLVPKSEYRKWQEKPARPSSRRKKKNPRPPRTEEYTDERVAEFLLSNTTDAADYARACKLVREMGLDPAKIDHDKPVGVG
jgi:hypothetical protein